MSAAIQCQNTFIANAREEAEKLHDVHVRVNVVGGAVALHRRDNEKLRADLKGKDAVIAPEQEPLMGSRDIISGGHPSSQHFLS